MFRLPPYDHVLLDEAWPVQQVTLQVAVRAKFRSGEGRQIQDRAVTIEKWIDALNQIGTAHSARLAAAWRIDDSGATRGGRVEDVTRGVDVNHIVARDAHVDRDPAAPVENGTDLPASDQRFAEARKISAERQGVNSRMTIAFFVGSTLVSTRVI